MLLPIKTSRNTYQYLKYFIVFAIAILGVVIILVSRNQAEATTSATSYQAGRIIDDAIFTNYNSMSVAQIQDFLNSKVTNCDTQGTQPASDFGRPDLTHAQYAALVGWAAPPYTCLKDYTENGLTAAQIIYNVAQKYQINPQVLIVLLQKEQGLVKDSWPLSTQYRTATGYGCPDTSVCNTVYYGFTNQVTWSATMFRAILNNNPNWYTPYVLGNNYIRYNPATSCGGTTVNIQNLSTQALYNYTPYQPNAAALNAGYGNGDSCSSYGNRNFYLYFNDWFGNSILANLPGCQAATNTTLACIWRLYNPVGGAEYLTGSNQVRDSLYVQNSYQYSGIAFYGNVVIMPYNIPVYRLTDPNGGVFLTVSLSDYDNLVAAGYTGNGVDFYADPPYSNSGYPVYRLYNPTTKQYIWTGSALERQTLIGYGYTDQGQAFSSISPVRQEMAPPAGKALVYRFYIAATYSHFWTTDINERDSMIQAGYKYEGVAWYSSTDTNDKPLYRLYSAYLNQHLFTTDPNEKAVLSTSGMWTYEGISEYVSPTANSSPVYRLYAPSLKTHLYTQDPNERSVLLASGNWNDEGVAWYQP